MLHMHSESLLAYRAANLPVAPKCRYYTHFELHNLEYTLIIWIFLDKTIYNTRGLHINVLVAEVGSVFVKYTHMKYIYRRNVYEIVSYVPQIDGNIFV